MEDSVTLSRFLRRSGEVLETVRSADVVLARRGDDDLLLTTVWRAGATRDALQVLGEVVLEALGDEGCREALVRSLASSARWTSVLTRGERQRLLADTAREASAAAGLGTAEPLARALDRWRRTARLRASERPVSAHLTRPVAIPDDVDDPSITKASGVVELPLRVRWSYPRRSYDLGDPRQLRRVYEQVLREGTVEDVRRFIDVDKLVTHWDELVLPPRVRQAWASWLRRRRGLDVAC